MRPTRPNRDSDRDSGTAFQLRIDRMVLEHWLTTRPRDREDRERQSAAIVQTVCRMIARDDDPPAEAVAFVVATAANLPADVRRYIAERYIAPAATDRTAPVVKAFHVAPKRRRPGPSARDLFLDLDVLSLREHGSDPAGRLPDRPRQTVAAIAKRLHVSERGVQRIITDARKRHTTPRKA